MRYGNEVRGVGTVLGNVHGNERFFRMPTRKAPHPERVVRRPGITFEELLAKVTLNGSVSFR
jgi:hypothetical protein